MGELSTYVNLGSVVQALRCNTSSTSLGVRHGSDWFFELNCYPYDGDVMNQLQRLPVSIEVVSCIVELDNFGERGNRL